MFPGVPKIRVVGNHHHEPPGIVVHSENRRIDVVGLFPCPAAAATVPHVWYLHDGIDIEERVKNFVIHRESSERPFWKYFAHLICKISELSQSPEVIHV